MVKCHSPRLDKTFAALADPTRRGLLATLAEGDASVTELARPIRMSLPAVSKHIRVLERANLVNRSRQGRVHRLHLQVEPMREAAEWLARYRQFWEGQFDALADYLENTSKTEES